MMALEEAMTTTETTQFAGTHTDLLRSGRSSAGSIRQYGFTNFNTASSTSP